MRKAQISILILLVSLFMYACDDTDVTSEPIETIPTVITDKISPQMSGADDIIITVGDSFDPLTGVTASDDTDGNVTHLIVVSGTFDIHVAGLYQITYSVSDQAGNQTIVTRLLTVKLRPIDQAILNWDQADSYSMSILFDSLDESYMMLVEITEALMRIEVLDEVIYYEIDGDMCYIYEMDQMVWHKNIVNCSEKGTSELQFLSNFSSDYFVEQTIEGVKTYVLKMEYYASLQSFLGSTITSDFKMILFEENISQVSFLMTRNSILFDMTITLSKFNSTMVSLPEVKSS